LKTKNRKNTDEKYFFNLLKNKREHPARRKNAVDFFYFCGSFLPSWIRIRGPHGIWIQSGSTTLISEWGVTITMILDNCPYIFTSPLGMQVKVLFSKESIVNNKK
jgi:hypothetical protein